MAAILAAEERLDHLGIGSRRLIRLAIAIRIDLDLLGRHGIDALVAVDIRDAGKFIAARIHEMLQELRLVGFIHRAEISRYLRIIKSIDHDDPAVLDIVAIIGKNQHIALGLLVHRAQRDDPVRLLRAGNRVAIALARIGITHRQRCRCRLLCRRSRSFLSRCHRGESRERNCCRASGNRCQYIFFQVHIEILLQFI